MPELLIYKSILHECFNFFTVARWNYRITSNRHRVGLIFWNVWSCVYLREAFILGTEAFKANSAFTNTFYLTKKDSYSKAVQFSFSQSLYIYIYNFYLYTLYIHTYIQTLSTMLKRKVGNCCIQRTEPTKQKKNEIVSKRRHQLDMVQRTKITSG